MVAGWIIEGAKSLIVNPGVASDHHTDLTSHATLDQQISGVVSD